MLTRMHGLVVEEEIRIVRTNQELRELDIVADNNKKRWEWIGHVVKMNQGRYG